MIKINLLAGLAVIFMLSCKSEFNSTVYSPDKKVAVTFSIEDSRPFYSVNRNDKPVILKSALGFRFKSAPSLVRNLKVTDQKTSVADETWEQPWGERRFIKNI
jgi:alpha-glucosidase